MSQPAPDTPRTVSRSTTAFLSGTFLSRLTGLGRDTMMAVAFGSHPAIAAFMVAFRFANLIRRLLGEGPLTAGFIPHFEQMRQRSSVEGAQFFRDLFFSLTLLLLAVVGGMEGIFWGILKSGLLSPSAGQILTLTMWMLPGMLFICLFGLCSSLLQCERRFFLTGFAPVGFNLVWIAATFFLQGRDPADAVLPLSYAVVIAFLIQWAMLAPQTFKSMKSSLSLKECLRPRLFSKELRHIVKPLFFGMIGVCAVQVNTTLDSVFARFASLEGPAYLWYAIRIQQLPLALFGIALSSALLPALARAVKGGIYDEYLRLLRFAVRRSFSLIFPCTLGIFVLGVAGVNLLYGHGDFTQTATYETVLCLWGYGLGLLPGVFVLLLAPAFYAKKEFRVPTLISIASMVLNVALNAIFVFGCGWGSFSIAVATSVAAWFNYFCLSYQLSKQVGQPLLSGAVFRAFLKTGGCSLVAAAATLFVGAFFIGDPTVHFLLGEQLPVMRLFSSQSMQFLALAGTFAVVFFSYARMFNAEDVLELIGLKPLQ